MRALMLTMGAVALTSPLMAEAQDLGAMQRCRALTEASARLRCYDEIKLPAPVSAPAVVAAVPEAVVAPAPAAQFGLEGKATDAELKQIDSQIVGEFEGWEARTIFRLANGQVWQVSDDSSAAYALRNPKVTIRRGVFGAFYLEVDGARRSPRVKRLR